ncbi:helix-turn-helix transcriptional regulator [Thermococcus piezophilus]|uniref:helix-turn-helix transcriptional regulator n=1 Tax=Thermococcus piezophilus TaxID=1712654 RepID=UPI000A90E0CF|nr:helix-turn-helix domain-containing protein [Thermococcus piezophilus]
MYPEDAQVVRVSYYTPDLTSKDGIVWTLKVSSESPFTVVLPENYIVVDLSDIPLEINGNSIVMPAGNQTVSYVLEYLPVGTETAQTQTTQSISETSASESFVNSTAPSTTGSSTETPSGGSTSWATIGILALFALSIGGFIYLKSGKEESGLAPSISREDFEKRLTEYDLTKDEEKALLYLFDRGGKARQSEVRETLGIPKTTAWRMFQRLEKQGLVRVYKKKRENWVELRL